MKKLLLLLLIQACLLPAMASSHREAPFVALNPAVDATDLYAFTSYETGRNGYITIIANYQGEQNPLSGPNYYLPDPSALYEIKIDNDGDAIEDYTFRFRFRQELVNENLGLNINVSDQELAIPFVNNGSFSALDRAKLNRELSYTIEYIKNKASFKYGKNFNEIVRGSFLENANDVFIPEFTPPNLKTYLVPEYNIGSNSISDYDSYANNFIYEVTIPVKSKKSTCTDSARVFAGPRQESFKANLSGIYDLGNKNLKAAENSATDEFASTNVFSIALEIPKACLDIDEDTPVLGIWTAASLPARRILKNKPSLAKASFTTIKDYVQVSRLGNPFVNQMMIGYKDKDLFNARRPRVDQNSTLMNYISYPTLPVILESFASLSAPTLYPRTDLEEVLLTGIDGINQSKFSAKTDARHAEILRLNTATTAIAAASQNRLGVLAGDNAGYPNGRRPGDDVTDIFLRILMGARLSLEEAAEKNSLLTDGVVTNATDYSDSFPYLLAP